MMSFLFLLEININRKTREAHGKLIISALTSSDQTGQDLPFLANIFFLTFFEQSGHIPKEAFIFLSWDTSLFFKSQSLLHHEQIIGMIFISGSVFLCIFSVEFIFPLSGELPRYADP